MPAGAFTRWTAGGDLQHGSRCSGLLLHGWSQGQMTTKAFKPELAWKEGHLNVDPRTSIGGKLLMHR